MRQKRYFTVEEANRLIPTLEQRLSELREFRVELEQLGAELTPLFEVIRHKRWASKNTAVSRINRKVPGRY